MPGLTLEDGGQPGIERSAGDRDKSQSGIEGRIPGDRPEGRQRDRRKVSPPAFIRDGGDQGAPRSVPLGLMAHREFPEVEAIVEFRAGRKTGQTIASIGDPQETGPLQGPIEPGRRDVVVSDFGVRRTPKSLRRGPFNVGQERGFARCR